jgi:hypothetical protein
MELEEILNKYPQKRNPFQEGDTNLVMLVNDANKCMKEYATILLRKQAEYIAKKAYGLYYDDAFDKNPSFVDCEPKSILTASENFIKTII